MSSLHRTYVSLHFRAFEVVQLKGKIARIYSRVHAIISVTYVVYTVICYNNTTVYYGIHELSESIPVDSGVTNLIHDRRSCVDFTL